MPITERGESTAFSEGIDDIIENAVLELGVHVGPRQAADNVIGLFPRFCDVAGKVLGGIIDHVEAGEASAKLNCAVGIEFDDKKLRLFAEPIQDHARERPGAGSEFDHQPGTAEIAV